MEDTLSPAFHAALAEVRQVRASGTIPSAAQMASIYDNASPAQLEAWGYDSAPTLAQHQQQIDVINFTLAENKRSGIFVQSDVFCGKCGASSAPESKKLKYCGGCSTLLYCGKDCATADWAEHKLKCAILRSQHDKALEVHKAHGGQEKGFNKKIHRTAAWFADLPGLRNEVMLTAWKHRSESPYIHAYTSPDDVDGSALQITVMSRSLWGVDRDRDIIGRLREIYDSSSFCADKDYMCAYTVKHSSPTHDQVTKLIKMPFNGTAIQGGTIVEALTAATRSEDLADAFAYVKASNTEITAGLMLRNIRNLSMVFHGIVTPHNCIPAPTRAINTEVAAMILHGMQLEVDICLMGLRSAAHLNGRNAVIRERDPANVDRWKARLDDGECVSVKAINFVLTHHGEFKRKSP